MSMMTIGMVFFIFAVVFGGIIAIGRVMEKRNALAVADGPGSGTGPLADEEDDTLDPKLAELAQRLVRAGISLSPEEFVKRRLFVTIGGVAVGMVMGGFSFGGLLFGGLLGFVGYKGADFYVQRCYNKRMGDFVDQFSDALGVMSNGVRSGQTIFQTLEGLVEDFNDPLREEIEEVLAELRMGVPLEDALLHWVERTPNEDLEIAATALIVQRQTGGNVSEILETVAKTIRERNKLFKQIKSLTGQGRMSGWVMTLLPIGLFFVLYLITPARVGLLVSHPLGLVMTAIGLGMIGIGGYFIRKIVTIDV